MSEITDLQNIRVPSCVGLIIDGNRRYARENNISPERAHYVGYERLKEFVTWAKDIGVKTLIVYTFSTENWSRSKEEVDVLMDLIRMTLTTELDQLVQKNVRLRIIGDVKRFPDDIQEMIVKAEEKTASGTEGTLALALSYGGRAEIFSAVQKFAALSKEEQDPEIIIRTGGNQRLSNFLPWQSTYSELYFTPTMWPAFTKEEFLEILKAYSAVVQNNGK